MKNARALEFREKVDAVEVDSRTTLLSEEEKESITVYAAAGFSESEVFRMAGSLEQNSKLPLAEAIVKKAKKRGLNLVKADNFQVITGNGAVGEVDGHAIAVGNMKLMENLSINVENLLPQMEQQDIENKIILLIAIDSKAAGLIALANSDNALILDPTTDVPINNSPAIAQACRYCNTEESNPCGDKCWRCF